MPGESNKINLQTSVTDLSTIYYLLGRVKDSGIVEEQYSRSELFPKARARVKTVGSDWDSTRRDTHTGLTLRELGLIEYIEDDHFRVSSMGNQFLSGFELEETPVNQSQVTQKLIDKLSDSNRIALLLTMLMGSRIMQPEYDRDIHPYGLLLKLLSDEDLNCTISKGEWACVANDSSALNDSQYDEFVQWIKEFRDDPTEVDLLKTDRTLTKLKAWGILQEVGGSGQATSYALTSVSKEVITAMKNKYLAAIRTKPYILLAGISGTGKSRMVRQLARGCCPQNKSEGGVHPLYDEGKPGNFEMIQVRPNWHDSSELMGYVSRIVKVDDPPKYVMTPFVEFLAKAWVYREVPFFLCLDEMNLAPVEQYFAEYLSVIETRKPRTLGPEGETIEVISTDPIIRWESLEPATLKNAIKDLFDGKEWAAKAEHGRVEEIEKLIAHDKGIRIPPNLVVMGTVNMDETTCSFSRKVLDRAMSFELNDVADMYDPAKLGTEGECDFATIPATAAEAKLLTGKEAYDSPAGQTIAITTDGTKVGDAILKILKTLNEDDVPAKKDDASDAGGTMPLLAKTPFKIAYRTRNEIMIYCVERIGNGLVALPQALDEAISMKILSRIEGDSQHVQKKWLVTLSAAIESELSKLDGYVAAKCTLCKEKLADMAAQADYGYTSFWTR